MAAWKEASVRSERIEEEQSQDLAGECLRFRMRLCTPVSDPEQSLN